MGKIIEITKQKRNTRGHRRHTISSPIKLGVTTLGFVTIMIACLLALLYLLQSNRTATCGFQIEEYDNTISKLTKEKAELELEAAKLRSTNQIKEKLETLNMQEVDPTKIGYYEMGKDLAIETKR